MTDANTTTTTTTTTTETLIVIREVVPLTTTVYISTSPILLLCNSLCRKKTNRALFHTAATTVKHSDSNGHATAATTRSRLPMGMNGTVSEQDFDNFCAALNGQINAYDAILKHRRKYSQYRNAIHLLIVSIWFKFFVGLFDWDRSMGHKVLMFSVGYPLFFATLTLLNLYFKHPIQQEIDKQNAIYQNINDACSDFTKTISTEMTVSPAAASSSSSPAPTILPCIIRITCTLESIKYMDDIGPYNNMDHIKFTVTTKTRATSTDENHHVYVDTPELNHIALNAHPTVTSILHIV